MGLKMMEIDEEKVTLEIKCEGYQSILNEKKNEHLCYRSSYATELNTQALPSFSFFSFKI